MSDLIGNTFSLQMLIYVYSELKEAQSSTNTHHSLMKYVYFHTLEVHFSSLQNKDRFSWVRGTLVLYYTVGCSTRTYIV